MRFNGLVFETTRFCNAACSHCYTDCGPNQSHDRLSVKDFRRVVDEAATIPEIRRRCSIAGGEATVFWTELLDMIQCAASKGFETDIVTNGFWAFPRDQAKRKIRELKEAGLARIELSIDAMHQEFIARHTVKTLLRESQIHGIPVALRVCTSRKNTIAQALEGLDKEDLQGTTIVSQRIIGVGRARNMPREDLFLKDGIPEGACYDALHLNIVSNGDVFPCCSGSELTESLKLGNIYDNTLHEILDKTNGNYMVTLNTMLGPSTFVPIIKAAGLEHKLKKSYGSYCELCVDIFSDKEMTKAVRQSLEIKESQIYENMKISLLKEGKIAARK